MTDKNLYDEYLKKALEHAPDADVQASAQVRNKVLGYAKNTVEKKATQPQNSWLASVKNWLLKDHFANAQWAGLTGLAAVFLVAILLWREHPEGAVGITDTPASIPESAEIAQPQASKEQPITAPPAELTPKESTLDQAAPAKTDMAKNAPAEQDNAFAKPSAPIAADNAAPKPQANYSATAADTLEKSEVARVAKPTKKSNDTNLIAKTTSTEGKAVQSVPVPGVVVPIEPAPTTDATPAPAEQTTMQTEDTGAVMDKSKNADLRVGTNTRRLKAESDALADNTDNHAVAKNLLAIGGQTMAKQDIQAGKLRLLKVVVLGQANENTQECPPAPAQANSTDAQTGLPIEHIAVCSASEKLTQAVAQYNQTMHDWVLGQNTPKNE